MEAVRPVIPPELFRDAHDYINRFDEYLLGIDVLIDSSFQDFLY